MPCLPEVRFDNDELLELTELIQKSHIMQNILQSMPYSNSGQSFYDTPPVTGQRALFNNLNMLQTPFSLRPVKRSLV